ncbi:hypothetical protein AS189_09555 [Arthrobacter alpinus]|uniref:Methyl-accepting chemotaxis protein n=1 Tax=Arthrobacter alpinus TaxID=656366 RepID=A0A0S2LYQ5_9MICC|nr:DUF4391 domain-containing protein [Arthrobacter alpinus]ALO66697.1 hypothetical protein AS189_09555 [Arthrobacter alpinus]
MTVRLYRWPAAAKFGKRVPKEKFYDQGTVTAAVREKFVSEVQRVTWAYKLAETTVNLTGNAEVPEIQVFHIEAKGNDVPDPVLMAIDRAIPFPIIFEIHRGRDQANSVRMVAAHKYFGGSAAKLSSYFTTDWMPANSDRQVLPSAINLPTLYTALLAPLTPVFARAGENMSEIAERLNTLQKLEREITALERKLRNEPQLNRKIELRRALKTKQAELEQQR